MLRRGPSVEDARAVCVLLHGRGRSPDDVLSLAERIGDPEVCFVAPAAADNSWWPGSFLAPFAENEPWLSSALGAVDALLHSLGVAASRVVLGGFSQGACLASEYALRHPGRYGGLLLYTGGFCGPRGTVPPRLGSASRRRRSTWAPRTRTAGCRLWRVQETSSVLSALGAVVEVDVFEGMDHLVNDAEIEAGRALLSGCG